MRNVASLYALSSASAPFQPQLGAAPPDWTINLSGNAPAALPSAALALSPEPAPSPTTPKSSPASAALSITPICPHPSPPQPQPTTPLRLHARTVRCPSFLPASRSRSTPAAFPTPAIFSPPLTATSSSPSKAPAPSSSSAESTPTAPPSARPTSPAASARPTAWPSTPPPPLRNTSTSPTQPHCSAFHTPSATLRHRPLPPHSPPTSPAAETTCTRSLVFTKEATPRLLVGVGSASNVTDTDTDPNEFHRADILAYSVSGTFQSVYASGTRNPVGLTLDPNGQVWISVNERDDLGDNLPADYVTHVTRTASTAGPGTTTAPTPIRVCPTITRSWPPRPSSPTRCFNPTSHPCRSPFIPAAVSDAVPGDLFVASHGSWNKAVRGGYELLRVRLVNGVATGTYEDFMTGFVNSDGTVWGRPAGVCVGADGALYVADDASEHYLANHLHWILMVECGCRSSRSLIAKPVSFTSVRPLYSGIDRCPWYTGKVYLGCGRQRRPEDCKEIVYANNLASKTVRFAHVCLRRATGSI